MWFFGSMQAALQLRAQRPQPLHFEVSITGFSQENRARNPSSVPTGQTVLHQVHPFGDAGQQVVAAAVERGEQCSDEASVGAVGGQQNHDGVDVRHQRDDEEDEYAVAEPPFFGRVGVAVFPGALSEGGRSVLQYAQRAEYRTVDAPEEQRGDNERRHRAEVHGQQGGQQLDAGQPAEKGVQAPREVEEEPGDRREAGDGEQDSDFS